MFWPFGEKEKEKPTVPAVGPWFLPRDYPCSGGVSKGIWRRRRACAEFAVANCVLMEPSRLPVEGFTPLPEKDVIDAIARNVIGSDRVPQDSMGLAAWFYAHGEEKNEILGNLDDGAHIARMLNKVAEAVLPFVVGQLVVPALFPEDNREMTQSLFLYACAGTAVTPLSANFATARMLAELYGNIPNNDSFSELRSLVLRYFSRLPLIGTGIMLNWAEIACDPNALDSFRRKGVPGTPMSSLFFDQVLAPTRD